MVRTIGIFIRFLRMQQKRMGPLVTLLLYLGVALPGLALDSLRVRSPNERLTFTFALEVGGVPAYQITYRQQVVVQPSRLGLLPHSNGAQPLADWTRSLRVVNTETRQVNTTWTPLYGERSQIPDRFNELRLTLQPSDDRRAPMQLIVRAYDEGVAFRYVFPEDLRLQILEIGEEATHFRLPAGTQGYYTDHAQGRYAWRPLAGWEAGAELPLTLRLPTGLWVCLAQAQQTQFPRMRLHTEAGQLVSHLFGEITESSPLASPWRVVMVAEKPGQLLENNYLILNLNPPNALTQTDWIKPGRVMREVTLSTRGAKALVDFAVEQHIDFIHFDAGWYGHEYEVASDATQVDVDPRRNPRKDLDLAEAIRYARAKGKGVILYVNRRALERQLDTLLPLYKRWGVAGIKFGFVQTGSHHWTVWLHEAVRKAAQYGLMVNIHDEYRPSGFSRTYPNLMTQEGIRGNEEFPDATHNTILPFTRFVAGAADYTYCFHDKRLQNTKGHQLALSIINYSPWQYLYWYDKPSDYADRAEVELWKELPTTWQHTRVLAGEPGHWVAVARQKGAEWFLGLITNNEARRVILHLDFLPKGTSFQADLYEDDGAGKIRKRTLRITPQTTLKLALPARGGVALRIHP